MILRLMVYSFHYFIDLFSYATQTSTPQAKTLFVEEEILFTDENSQLSGNYKINGPQINTVNVVPQPVGKSLHFKGGLALETGFYSLERDGRPISTIAVNHNSKELKKPFLETSAINPEMTILDPDNFYNEIKNKKSGFELWFLFLVLSFLMILLEIIIIKLIEGTPFLKNA